MPVDYQVRSARPDELPAIGSLTASVYLAEGFAGPDYAARLADAPTRARLGDLLVAVDAGRLLGAVSLFTQTAGGDWAEDATEGEAVLRMLVVAPDARRRGVGAALTTAAMHRATQLGCDRVVLSSHPGMHAAHRLYARLGFARRPDRDRQVGPDLCLARFVAERDHCGWCGQAGARHGGHPSCTAARPYDPPRFCAWCGRRMVVQVLPTSWTAHCRVHGRSAG